MSSEGFDADRDCVTGMDVPVEDILKAAERDRFDALYEPVWTWADLAALAVLKDLSWRNGIGPVLKAMDPEARVALSKRASAIVEAASKEHVASQGLQLKVLGDCFRDQADRLKDAEEEIRSLRNRLADVVGIDEDRLCHLRTLSAILRGDRDGVTEDDIEAALQEGWLRSGWEWPSKGVSFTVTEIPEVVAQLTKLTEERDEAVSRADLADYCREALAARCKDLEAQLAVEGRRSELDPGRSPRLRRELAREVKLTGGGKPGWAA